MSALAAPLERGVWGILATPFNDDGSVDMASLAGQVALFGRVGARGVVALGVFGEGARLDDVERRLVTTTVLRTAQELDLGVVVGLTTLDREATLSQADAAVSSALAIAGHAALRPGGLLRGMMVQVPTDEPDALSERLTAVHTASGAGIVVQDYPRSSGVTIDAATLAATVAPLPWVVAVKAESTPTVPAIATLTAGCDAPVFGGLGGVALIDELGAGASGAMTGFSYPEALVATVRAYDASGLSGARSAWAPWLPLAVFEQQEGLALGIRKEVLRRRGVLRTAAVRAPAAAFPSVLDGLLTAHLADADGRLGSVEH